MHTQINTSSVIDHTVFQHVGLWQTADPTHCVSCRVKNNRLSSEKQALGDKDFPMHRI